MIAYTYDEELKKNINSKKKNYWETYIYEILDLMGVKGTPVSLKDIESYENLERYRVLIIGAQSGRCINSRVKNILSDWVMKGGMLIGFAVEGLDETFGIHKIARINQEDEYSISALFEFLPHPLTYDIHPLMFYEERLIILSDFLSISLKDGVELGLLYNTDGTSRKEPAITWRSYGSGFAIYFVFDVPKTLWLLHQGKPVYPSPDSEGYEKTNAMQVIGNRSNKICYADEIVFLLQNLIAQTGHPFIYQIPPDGDKIPEALLYWGGDEYFGPVEYSLNASDWMRSKGLPYHINIGIERTYGKEDGHPITLEQVKHIIEDNKHEISLYYMLYEDNNYDITPERIKRQSDLFYKRFGFRPVCTLHYNTSWKGWVEPARWMVEAGGKADNSFASASIYRPYNHPSRNSPGYGFGYGTAYPFFFRDDYEHENKRLEFIEQPIVCYEIGHRGLGRGAQDPVAFKPEDIHLALDRAIEYHQVINMFYHPVNIVKSPATRAAIEEVLRYIEYRQKKILHMANNQLTDWWFARSSSEIKDINVVEQETEFTVAGKYPEGMIIKILIPEGKTVDRITIENKVPVYEIKHEFRADWLYFIVPSGEHKVKVKFK